MDEDWETRVAALWASLDEASAPGFPAKMDALVAERPAGDPAGLYERGSAWDSTGHSDRAVPLYREALAAGLSGSRRRECTIQLASSLRNLGEAAESVWLLEAERAAGSDELDDAVAAFLALALADAGRAREAVGVAVGALAGHLTRFRNSAINYAHELREP
jgi:Tetratrico peptide repeat